jgi:multicomponent Na+:H+ antiporter subunit E
MKTFFSNIFLAFIWVTLTMKFNPTNLLFGFVLSYFILWGIQRNTSTNRYFKFILRLIDFIALFVKEVIVGSLKIGFDIITPHHYMNPGIIAVPLDAKTDIEITLLANSITLTPGTTSLAVSKDKSTLYVYCVYIDKKDKQKTIQDIKNGLEKKILEVLR